MPGNTENLDGDGPAGSARIRPYPLLRRFLQLVLPLLAIGLTGLLVAAIVALSTIVERVYEAEATRRHALVVTSIAAKAPDALAAFAANRALDRPQSAALQTAVRNEARENGLTCIILIAADGANLVADGPACPPLTEERRAGIKRRVASQLTRPGAALFNNVEETAVPAWSIASVLNFGAGKIVIATLRDAAPLEEVVGTTTLVWVGGLAFVLVLSTGLAVVIVVQAQREIDARTGALNEAREAIARFVSKNVRTNAQRGQAARKCVTAVLFIDIRDFSGFADTAPVEAAVALVTAVAEIAFEAVLSNGGDVDRLVGDGLVARFDGADRTARAFAAAARILGRVADARLPRGVGIGLSDGEVVEATIASGDRADATILGRTVNLSARLCSAASPGEIFVQAELPAPKNSPLVAIVEENLSLKGHRTRCRAVRYALPSATRQAETG